MGWDGSNRSEDNLHDFFIFRLTDSDGKNAKQLPSVDYRFTVIGFGACQTAPGHPFHVANTHTHTHGLCYLGDAIISIQSIT